MIARLAVRGLLALVALTACNAPLILAELPTDAGAPSAPDGEASFVVTPGRGPDADDDAMAGIHGEGGLLDAAEADATGDAAAEADAQGDASAD